MMRAPIRIADAGSVPVDTPILIVGGGACGVVAAMAAQRAGVAVAVLERDALPRGSTALSSGFVPAPSTQAQRRAGIGDSATLFADDIQRKAKGHADPQLVRMLTDAIGATLDWLEQQHGIPFQVLREFLYPGHSVARMHCVPERSGDALLSRLWAAAQGLDIALITEAKVTTLVVDADQRLLGVDYVHPDGTRHTIGCAQAILACNGFGGNRDMVARFIPQMREALYFGHAGNDGCAIEWGEALGAQLADTGAYQGHGSVAHPHGLLITWGLIMAGGIQVNRDGRRFWDESQGYSEAALPVLAQPDGIAWLVYDDRVHRIGEAFPEYREAIRLDAVRRGADVAALARGIGVDPKALAEELRSIGAASDDMAWAGRAIDAAAHVIDGEAIVDRFGRRFDAASRMRAPWFAIRVTGALFHTQGGLAIDAQMRVRLHEGGAIANLRAAGGAARGVSGDAVWGYLSGNGLLSAIAGGYLAGTAAAEEFRSSAAGSDLRPT